VLGRQQVEMGSDLFRQAIVTSTAGDDIECPRAPYP